MKFKKRLLALIVALIKFKKKTLKFAGLCSNFTGKKMAYPFCRENTEINKYRK